MSDPNYATTVALSVPSSALSSAFVATFSLVSSLPFFSSSGRSSTLFSLLTFPFASVFWASRLHSHLYPGFSTHTLIYWSCLDLNYGVNSVPLRICARSETDLVYEVDFESHCLDPHFSFVAALPDISLQVILH